MAFKPLLRLPVPFHAVGMTNDSVTLRHVGGPTAVIEMVGLRFLTDPTFDPPGAYPTPAYTLTKTSGPAVPADELGPFDVVLLSHHQHSDNLDRSGHSLLSTVPLVLSTPAAADEIGPPVTPLAAWDHVDVPSSDRQGLRVTAVPAEHGPPELGEITGPVTGFVLSGPGVPTVYVSGDNASLDAVRAVADRFPDIDVAVLFGGAARAERLGPVNLTLGGDDMATAAAILGARHVYPVHADGWSHFSEGLEEIRTAFDRAGMTDRLAVPPPHARPLSLS
jgi:L-ascorbate metabolism protein UlaG (beta-lactamase superfamily)